MTSVSSRARPLVYCSNRGHEQAQRLLPRGAIIETLVEAAIANGDVQAGVDGGVVFLAEHRLVARVKRVPGRVRPRPRAWAVVSLERDRRSGRGGTAHPGNNNDGG